MAVLSDIKGERALDILAEMLDPLTEILADKEIKPLILNGTKVQVLKKILKDHKESMIAILALLDDKDPETYEPTLPEIPVKIMQILNDPAFKTVFTAQGQSKDKASSGSATENTEAKNE